MNKFIAFCIVGIMMMTFISQFSQQVKNTHYLANSETIITAACEQAKQEGYFTTEIVDRMKDEFDKSGIDSSRVEFELTTTPKYRTDAYDNRELITYKIGVPIDSIFACHSFWGLTDAQNSYIKYYNGAVASEKIAR